MRPEKDTFRHIPSPESTLALAIATELSNGCGKPTIDTPITWSYSMSNRSSTHCAPTRASQNCCAISASSRRIDLSKSGQATLGHRYSPARVSKRLTDGTAACLRARRCADLACLDLVFGQERSSYVNDCPVRHNFF